MQGIEDLAEVGTGTGEELPFTFLAPSHMRDAGAVAQWLEGPVQDLVVVALQLVNPEAHGGNRPSAPVDPSVISAILLDLYCATIASAEALQGVEPARAEGVGLQGFARLIAEANRIGLDESGYPRLIGLLRAAGEASARTQALATEQRVEVVQ